MIEVSQHARLRYIERVAPGLTPPEAAADILTHERALAAAVAYECEVVRLGCGARLILKGNVVITVLAATQRGPVWGARSVDPEAEAAA